jgi:hypothetical protein
MPNPNIAKGFTGPVGLFYNQPHYILPGDWSISNPAGGRKELIQFRTVGV